MRIWISLLIPVLLLGEKLAPVEMAGLEAPADQEHAPMTRLLDSAAQEVFERGHLS